MGWLRRSSLALSRFQIVVRDRSKFELHFQGQKPSISRKSGAGLAVRYVLEGSVRKAGGKSPHHRAVDRCGDRARTSGQTGFER